MSSSPLQQPSTVVQALSSNNNYSHYSNFFQFPFFSRTSFNSLPSFYFLYLLYLLLQLEATDDGLYAGVLGSGLGDGESNELVTFVGNENG